MKYSIKRAVVLGAGTMGSQIAAHLANCGVEVLLLDLPSPDAKSSKDRNKIAHEGLLRAIKSKPPAFFTQEFSQLVKVGNFEDDLKEVAKADWVIEVVVERMDIKKNLLKSVREHWLPGTIVSTNTSGLSINQMVSDFDSEFQHHFLGTHFFNPVRFMKLVELIPAGQTDPELISFMEEFMTNRLGKGVAIAKDTPNFIANRLGVFGIFYTIRKMIEMDLSVEEVDAITGRAMGRPRSATFRTIDLVGIDTLLHVARNVYEGAKEDEMREVFKPPDFLESMVKSGFLGDKAGKGFYKRVNGKRFVIDWKTLEYKELKRPSIPSVERALAEPTPEQRLKTLISGTDRYSQFAWETLSGFLIYSANRAKDIANDIFTIDKAIKWGFNFRLGPFETCDTLGLEYVAKRWAEENREIPTLIKEVLEKDHKSFYYRRDVPHKYYDFVGKNYKVMEFPPQFISLEILKQQNREVLKNDEASLIDIGDGVALFEFHSRANTIGPGTVELMMESLEKVGEDFDALVIGNQGQHFSAGANLALILQVIGEEEWDDLDFMVKKFQEMNMVLKYFEKPVVSAPFGRVLGGGAEIVMHTHRAQAAAETYIGLVEVAVGLLPAGGGTKEMLYRYTEDIMKVPDADPFPYIREALTTIGMAKVSMSAHEAKKLRYLRESDGISINSDHVLYHAKSAARSLADAGYKPPVPQNIKVTGESGFAYLKMLIFNLKEAKRITEHDAVIATEIARVLTGGSVPFGTEMTENQILDLEREAFLRLCGLEKTQQRMAHMLEKGRPLRN